MSYVNSNKNKNGINMQNKKKCDIPRKKNVTSLSNFQYKKKEVSFIDLTEWTSKKHFPINLVTAKTDF